MLKALRKNTKAIIWTVILVFLLWGGFSVGVQFRKEGRIAGEVFGAAVSFQEFERFQRMARIFSPAGADPASDPVVLRSRAWENLILDREAKRRKVSVTDQEVLAEVRRLLESQKIDPASPDQYKTWLRQAVGEEARGFEEKVREMLRIQKLVVLIRAELKPAEPDEKKLRDAFLENFKRLNVAMVRLEIHEEASELRSKIQNAQDWENEIRARGVGVETTGVVTAAHLRERWNLAADFVRELAALEPGSFSGVFEIAGGFCILQVLESYPADESAWTEELHDKYRAQYLAQAEFEALSGWHMQLMEKARLKDHFPQADL